MKCKIRSSRLSQRQKLGLERTLFNEVKRMNGLLSMLIIEAMYADMVDFEIIEEKYKI